MVKREKNWIFQEQFQKYEIGINEEKEERWEVGENSLVGKSNFSLKKKIIIWFYLMSSSFRTSSFQ